jgi:hypothetical protein
MMPTPQKTPLRGAGAAFLEYGYMEEDEAEEKMVRSKLFAKDYK